MKKHEKNKEKDGKSSSIFIAFLRRIKKALAASKLADPIDSFSVLVAGKTP